ncbi:hypothetical protein GF337_04660 [candidate division KSB1 bacterium]|nr:hypothetical protein [candidate division KSB1 bacterium]
MLQFSYFRVNCDQIKKGFNMTTTQDPFFQFTSVAMEKKTYLNLLYLLLTFPLGVLYFVILVTGFSLSMGLLFLLIGAFIGLGFLILIRGISKLHLALASNLLGFKLPVFNNLESQKDTFAKAKELVTDSRTYTSILYMFIEFPLGILYFTMIFTMLMLSISFIISPIINIVFDANGLLLNTELWIWELNFEESLLLLVGGIFLFFVTLHLSNMFARVEENLCKSLLAKI